MVTALKKRGTIHVFVPPAMKEEIVMKVCKYIKSVKIANESPRYNPGLRSNPGHVVIIFTRVAVANGARRYDCMM